MAVTLNKGHILSSAVGLWLPVPEYSGGPKLIDLSPYGNHGTLNGGVTWTTGQQGMELKFNGTSQQYISLPTARFPTGNTPFSMFAWFSSVTPSGLSFMMAYGAATQDEDMLLGLWGGEFYTSTHNTSLHSGVFGLNDGRWHLVGVSYFNDLVALFVDGKYIQSLSVTMNLVNTGTGYLGQAEGGFFYNGSVGGSYLFPFALTSAQVSSLYQNSLAGYPGLFNRSATKYFQMVGKTYNETGSGGALGGGTATTDVYYNPTTSGGATSNCSASFDDFESRSASGGSLAGGEAVITATYQPVASGGAMTNGSYAGGYLYPQVASGGLITNGTARLGYQQFFVQVASCSNGQKCGFSDDDQFCADELLVQSYGSKFVGVRRRNPSAFDLDPKKSAYGSAAMVPAITLCRQKIRLRPEDQRLRRIISR